MDSTINPCKYNCFGDWYHYRAYQFGLILSSFKLSTGLSRTGCDIFIEAYIYAPLEDSLSLSLGTRMGSLSCDTATMTRRSNTDFVPKITHPVDGTTDIMSLNPSGTMSLAFTRRFPHFWRRWTSKIHKFCCIIDHFVHVYELHSNK